MNSISTASGVSQDRTETYGNHMLSRRETYSAGVAVLPCVEWVTSLAGQRGSEWCSPTTIYLTSDVTASGEYGLLDK